MMEIRIFIFEYEPPNGCWVPGTRAHESQWLVGNDDDANDEGNRIKSGSISLIHPKKSGPISLIGPKNNGWNSSYSDQ